MKKCLLLVLICLLSGCSQPKNYETVMDSEVEQQAAERLEILVNLPAEAAKSAMTSEGGEQLYICEDYSVSIRTVTGGDLRKTVQEVCGFYPEQLPVIETMQGESRRYDFVWTAAGETGDQIGRCAILDDGSYHYIVSAMADASLTGELTDGAWREIFTSFRIVPAEEVVSSGS